MKYPFHWFRKTGIWILLFVCCFLLGCNNKQPHNNIICFVDFSEAPEWNKRLEDFRNLIQHAVIGNMRVEESIVVLPIDKASLTAGTEIYKATFKKELQYIPERTSPIDEDKVLAKNVQQDRDSFSSAFARRFETVKSERIKQIQGTDIFGALEQAKKYVEPDQKNIIILFSDMMNWSSELKMEPDNFSLSSVNIALQKAPSVQIFNARVIVFTGNLSQISQLHFKAVKQFWTEYFKKQNIELVEYSSGAVTSLEKAISSK